MPAKFSVPKPQLNDNMDNVVVVDSLPIVTAEKLPKLEAALKKVLSKFGTVETVHLAANERSLGYAFVEFTTADQANAALVGANNFSFGKSTLSVNLFSDLAKFAELSEEYEKPSVKDFRSLTEKREWLLDSRARDQYLVRSRRDDVHETELFWNDPADGDRVLVNGGEKQKNQGTTWCDRFAGFSPLGTYMYTEHADGLQLWAGDDMERVGRFPHQDFKRGQFSPNEKYLITFNGRDRPKDAQEKGPAAFHLWDIASGRLLRPFQGGYALTRKERIWPVFKWSFDDSLLARVEKDKIMVYDASTGFRLLDKRSLQVPEVHDCQWAPAAVPKSVTSSRKLLAYTVPGTKSRPCEVSLVSLPSRDTVRDRHLVRSKDLRLRWHPQARYLAVSATRLTRQEKEIGTHLVIFRTHEQNVPVDELQFDEPVLDVNWEPNGNRFCVVLGQETSATVRFYEIVPNKNKINMLFETPGKFANKVMWSPAGRYCCVAGLGKMNGYLYFYDVKRQEILTDGVMHPRATHVEWDPSGRYLASVMAQPLDAASSEGGFRFMKNNAYKIWSHRGVELVQQQYLALLQFTWRPRPPTILSQEEQRKVRSELKSTYVPAFRKEDDAIRSRREGDSAATRRVMTQSWRQLRANHRARATAWKPETNADDYIVETVVKEHELS
ncbi:MAG: hypothetical protein MHM6MM_000124 [Cercozoa sp. M6MM]